MTQQTQTDQPTFSQQLRAALDAWCEAPGQEGVIRLVPHENLKEPEFQAGYQARIAMPDFEGSREYWFVVDDNRDYPSFPVVELKNAETLLALIALACEQNYRPFLEFAAQYQCTGCELARRWLALPTAKSMAELLGQVQKEIGSRLDIAQATADGTRSVPFSQLSRVAPGWHTSITEAMRLEDIE